MFGCVWAFFVFWGSVGTAILRRFAVFGCVWLCMERFLKNPTIPNTTKQKHNTPKHTPNTPKHSQTHPNTVFSVQTQILVLGDKVLCLVVFRCVSACVYLCLARKEEKEPGEGGEGGGGGGGGGGSRGGVGRLGVQTPLIRAGDGRLPAGWRSGGFRRSGVSALLIRSFIGGALRLWPRWFVACSLVVFEMYDHSVCIACVYLCLACVWLCVGSSQALGYLGY